MSAHQSMPHEASLHEASLHEARPAGRVTLVGGGPGDPDLITVAGLRALMSADVVLADRLAPRELLADLPPHVRVHDVGKGPGAHVATQDQINELLVAEAAAGHHVVRFKGGDPFVLGRGGEEVEYVRAHGFDVRVIPGITSAVAVPGAAGIPVTHRGLAAGFSVVTGHGELASVPADPAHTLVVLMGVARLPETAAELARRGLPAATPVAIVENGCTPEQRTTVATLETIVDAAGRAGVANPAVIVVGDVVRVASAPEELARRATAGDPLPAQLPATP